jgi:hypothetical protein
MKELMNHIHLKIVVIIYQNVILIKCFKIFNFFILFIKMINIIKDRRLTYSIIILYILSSFFIIFTNKIFIREYIALFIFISFKTIFNYKKCTISYIECKLRGVKKEEGYLYTFLQNFINIRYTKYFPLFICYIFIVLYYHFVITKQKIFI